MSIDERLNAQVQQASGDGEPATPATPVDLDGALPADAVEASLPDELPGKILAARRQALRLSIDEVAARLKLAPRQLALLEANDFASLPGMAIVRGFIRSYAKLLGLDPQPLVTMLAHEPNPAFEPLVVRRPLPSSVLGRRYAPPTRHRSGSRRMAGLGVLVLAFVGVLAFAAYRNGALTLPSPDFSAVTGLLAPADKPAEPLAAEAVAEPEQPPVPAAEAANVLELRLREDAWVEVIATEGRRKLVSRLMKAGSVEVIEIGEPVTLVVGNASGVDAALRGEVLNLKAATRDNVARISLK